ncbi:hypothetical protein CBM2586_A10706 [Cupriavidus phytorum]|uniref:Uncharacterized protein n=1 Tax=Cupriavidus taiwanensis TaxID=164546 RepID=A0A976AJN9_9BURK|nr:hypothetical protein CBM2586_A10706 [Cupriavidus taiwanensis]SOY86364.1 hypothetical protein CBM2599_A40070 [Cupriavidus taiwanensis]SOY89646.1 hypothetical protein CBM2600_A50072 [Cupriavidus taiwanensis]SPD63435.1 protein of unknown function [Cupriavidus taiwanensis]
MPMRRPQGSLAHQPQLQRQHQYHELAVL